MKLLLSLAMVLFVSGAAHAAAPSVELVAKPGEATTLADQNLYYDFGVVDTRFSSYAYFDLTNRGNGELWVDRIAISGIDFSARHTCPQLLYPGQVCTIRVQFAPMFEGLKRGALYIDTNSGLITINLSGWGRYR